MDGRELVVRGGVTIDEQAAVLAGDRVGDPQFLHAVLCQLGLPRNPTSSRTFERTSGRASLRLQAGATFDGMKWVDQPLPSGTRPRVVLINLCSESVRTQSADIDIGSSVRQFLGRLGIDAGGASMRRFRKQMLALSACHMTLALPTPKGAAQIDAKPIDAFQAWHTDEGGQQALWPGHIRLTAKFFESLMEHAVPLDCEAIGQLQNSALALDVYSWLAHRLWRVREGNGIDLSWAALKAQFGQEYRDIKNFKKEFAGALQKAVGVYKEARIESVTGGLRLLPSPPPVKRKMVALPASTPAGPPPAASLPLPASGRLGMHDLVSEKALQEVPEIAPGWDKHHLAETYVAYVNDRLGGKRPDRRDAAFLGWVKKFTKKQRPA